jgi:1-acyl-sn-glycerol-3-phosphate acyltransferase
MQMLVARWLRLLFFLIVVRPLILVVLGLCVRHRERLPGSGPAIVVANHNSHLDTLALMTLFPTRLLSQLRPVAAADYFLRNRLVAWFSTRIIGIVPLDREARDLTVDQRLQGVYQALEEDQIVILFPEGSRGEPESLSRFKRGIAVIAGRFPQVPVTPIFLHGMGKALPRGEGMLVPFFCDVLVGEPLEPQEDDELFMIALEQRMHELAEEGEFPPWD